jgi:hypothetical protein
MHTVLDEILVEGTYLNSESHLGNGGCRCETCKSTNDSETDLEIILNELNIKKIEHSCEPGRFPRNRFGVIEWGKRDTPLKRRNLPKDNDIKIIGRARKRVLFNEIEKPLLEYRNLSIKSNNPNFSTRLPINIAQFFPEVDLTIDLFYNRSDLNKNQLLKESVAHIRQNRIPEYTGCSKGYSVMLNVSIVDYQKIEAQYNASLSELFRKTGIQLPLEKNKEDISKFFFLVYFVFPDELEKYLISPEPNRSSDNIALSEDEIKLLVEAIIGEEPKVPNPFWSFYKFAGLRPYGLKKFFKLYFKGLAILFGDNPQEALKGVIGASYALMDVATGFNRGVIHPRSLREGYHSMKKRIIDLENIPEISIKQREALNRLAMVKSKPRAIDTIYKTLLPAYTYEGNTQGRSINAAVLGHCRFSYPTIRSTNCRII